MIAGAPLALAFPAAPAGSCGWSCRAGCASSRRSSEMDHDCLTRRPIAAGDRRAGADLARAHDATDGGDGVRERCMTPQQYVQEKAAKSGSSFYYAFLFLPPPRRAAITAFYAFCREVDDVVDEVHDPGVAATEARAGGATKSAASFAGQPSHPGDESVDAASSTPTASRSRHLHAVIDGCQMDLEQVALSRLRRPRALLPSGGRRGRRGGVRHLRAHRCADGALRTPARAWRCS